MPTETKYTTDETWLRIEGDTATVGITDYAQEQLNELVFVKLPTVGQRVEQREGGSNSGIGKSRL